MYIKDNVMLMEYFYGDDYAFEEPFDVALELTMEAISKIIQFEQVEFHVAYKSWTYGTSNGWTADLGGIQGTGLTMLEASYNSLVKYVKNEKERSKEKEE